MKELTKLKSYNLFEGIGGFRLALEKCGHTCVGSCEIDKHARETYKNRFGSYPTHSDARNIIPEDLPDFDILTAGFPCQAFSLAGKRLGFEESRGTLFFEIARIAKQKRPRFLLLENVKGLLSHDNGKTFAVILATLDEIGYDAEWQVLNSRYFVPQSRERVFIIGHLRGKPFRKIFPITEDGGQILQRSTEQRKRLPRPSRTLVTSMEQHTNTFIVEPKLKQVGTMENIKYEQANRVYDGKGLARTLTSNDKTGLYVVGGSSGYNDSVMKDCSPTLRAAMGTGGGNVPIIIPKDKRIRKLTPLECERLQSFPEGWTIGVSDTQRYKQLGNAVTVDVVEYIVKNLG